MAVNVTQRRGGEGVRVGGSVRDGCRGSVVDSDFEGPFSIVLTPNLTSKVSFSRLFIDLQHCHALHFWNPAWKQRKVPLQSKTRASKKKGATFFMVVGSLKNPSPSSRRVPHIISLGSSGRGTKKRLILSTARTTAPCGRS